MQMQRGRRVGLAGLAVTTAAIGYIGSSAAGTASAASSSASAITHAAEVSEAAEGYTIRLSVDERVPGAGTVTTSGSGAFSVSSRSGTMSLSISDAGKSYRLQEIILGPVVYMKLPAALRASYKTDKPWLKLDLSKAGKSLSSIASLESSSAQNNPASSFAYLQAAAKNVQNLGSETVNGISTTHYRMTVNLLKAGAGLAPSVRARIEKALHNLPGKIDGETALPIDVWVDGSSLVRKMRYAFKITPQGSTQTVSTGLTMEITGYGAQPTPPAPPKDQTANLLMLLKKAGA